MALLLQRQTRSVLWVLLDAVACAAVKLQVDDNSAAVGSAEAAGDLLQSVICCYREHNLG
jgi:hypothetical protein